MNTMTVNENRQIWIRTIRYDWSALVRGEEITYYKNQLPHPEDSGLKKLIFAEPHGQKADYAVSFDDGSRAHIHEFEDRYVIHRDKYDPGKGFSSTVKHIMYETRTSTQIFAAVGMTCCLIVVGLVAPRAVKLLRA